MACAAAYPVVIGIPRELELHPCLVERESVPEDLFIIVQLSEPAKTRPWDLCILEGEPTSDS